MAEWMGFALLILLGSRVLFSVLYEMICRIIYLFFPLVVSGVCACVCMQLQKKKEGEIFAC